MTDPRRCSEPRTGVEPQPPAPEPALGPSSPDAPTTGEAEITAAVRAELGRLHFTTGCPIVARFEDGRVILEGCVELFIQRACAEAVVWAVPGVRGVTNLLLVRPPESVRDIDAKIERALARWPVEPRASGGGRGGGNRGQVDP